MNDQLLKPVEVAEILKINAVKAYMLLERGEIQRVRIGKLIRVRREDLERYILENKVRNASERHPKV